jgi:hypothetical protein
VPNNFISNLMFRLALGEFRLGDRDDGSIILNGNDLRISASRYRAEDTILVIP